MSLDAIRRDCAINGGIGPLFWESLLGVCGRVARRYPPTVYNHGEQWSDESFRDLAQDVTLERLLKGDQLAYVMDVATDKDSLERLLAFQVSRVLSHRRSMTVVDRLLRRIEKQLAGYGYELIEAGSDRFVRSPGVECEPRRLGDEDLRLAVALIAGIPRIPSNPSGERESKVYSTEDLRHLLDCLVHRFDCILISDVRKILEDLLTVWLPTTLHGYEDRFLNESTPELELQRLTMTTLISSVSAQLDDTDRRILVGKSRDVSDGELARQIGRSRPWVANQKAKVLVVVEQQLIGQLPEALHDEAVRALLDYLASNDQGGP